MLGPDRRRRLLLALTIWAVCTAVFFAVTPEGRLSRHTSANHFALLAESILHGRLDLPGGPPAYSGNNDFAQYAGKTWVVFPAFPALLLLPFVALAGSAEGFRDGLFFLWLAGLSPALFFLVLERLGDAGLSLRSERENVGLAVVLGLGTVYFFSAVQGTVWFAAHVVSVGLVGVYLLASIEARAPVLAGLALGLGAFTRTPLAFAFPFFVYEAFRMTAPAPDHGAGSSNDETTPSFASFRLWAPPLLRAKVLPFLVAAAVPVALMLWMNHTRFGNAFETGYRYLAITWQARIERWGLFSPHYLGRNLAVALTSTPFTSPPGTAAGAPLQISAHGLALWLTTPVYLWLVRAQAGLSRGVFLALLVTALAVATPSLLYQNTGQLQFGFRFSNDFAVFLLAALAVSSVRLSRAFWTFAIVGIVVNGFGAYTFDNPRQARFYDLRQPLPIHRPD